MCRLGGAPFSVFDLRILFRGRTVLQRQYDRFVGGGVLNIQLVAPTSADLAELARIVSRIEFSNKGYRQATEPGASSPRAERQSTGPGVRFDIYWANSTGQRVYSPRQVYPDDHRGPKAEVSLAGVHVELLLNRKLRCRDINHAARNLADLGARNPGTSVTIAAVPEVPWKWVAVAIDACARARIRRVSVKSVRGLTLDPCAVLVQERARRARGDAWPSTLPFVMRSAPPRAPAGRSIAIAIVLEEGLQPWLAREKVALDGRRVDLKGVREALASAAKGSERPVVIIAADAEASFRPVLEVLRACGEHGLSDVSFAVRGISREFLR
jgi:hypothetical protein